MKKFSITMLLLSSLFMVTMGCSQHNRRDYSKLNLVEVSGKIELDGQPLEKAQIFFIDKKTKTYSFGLTDADGNYELAFDSLKSGVMPGEKTVTIWTAKGGLEFGDALPDEEQLAQIKEKVPKKYNEQSELTASVLVPEEKSRQTFDFTLTSKMK